MRETPLPSPRVRPKDPAITEPLAAIYPPNLPKQISTSQCRPLTQGGVGAFGSSRARRMPRCRPAVDATGVTPWAARARADHPNIRDEVKRNVLERTPSEVRVTLEATVDELLANWVQVAGEQTANGAAFY